MVALTNVTAAGQNPGIHSNEVAQMDSLIEAYRDIFLQDPDRAIPKLDTLAGYCLDKGYVEQYLKAKKAKLFYYQLNYAPSLCKDILVELDSVIRANQEIVNYDSLYSQNQYQWGIYYYKLGLFPEAVERFKYYDRFLPDGVLNDHNCSIKYSVQQFLAATYEKMGAYNAAIQTALNSFRYRICNSSSRGEVNFHQAYFLLARYYQKAGDNRKAEAYYRLGEEDMEKLKNTSGDHSREILLSYCRLAEYSLDLEQFNQAREYLDSATVRIDPNDVFTLQAHTLYGDLYVSKKEFAQALQRYSLARDAYRQLQGNHSPELGIVNRKAGNVYREMEQFDEAIAYYDASIRSLVYNYVPGKPLPLDRLISPLELQQTLDAKAGGLLTLYDRDGKKEHLEQADQVAGQALELLEHFRYDLITEEDRQRQLAMAYPLLEKAILAKQLLYQINPIAETANEMLTLMGQSKGLGLTEMANHLLINDERFTDLFEEERQWKTRIAEVEKAIFSELSSGTDPDSYRDLLDQEKQLKYGFLRWNQETRNRHPDYFDLKLSRDSNSFSTIRHELLTANQGFIEYFWGDEFLFTMYVSREHVGIQKTELTSLRDTLNLFLNLLHSDYSREQRSGQVRLQELSYALYASLLQKPLSVFGRETSHLMIIPDGKLGSLPFELLIDEKPDNGFLQPQQFILQDYTISYAHAVPLLVRQYATQENEANSKASFAGFAPAYNAMPDSVNSSNQIIADLTRSGYVALPGAQEELKVIRELIGGRAFRNKRASEASFKKNAGQFDILHLAMHALPDHQDPQYSSLLFSVRPAGPDEDGRLQAIEIYNQQLQARMVVLSACNTGFGSFRRGEGIISLGHAFTYAGVPSIVHSHWKVPDAATAEIMKRFYRNLKNGDRKDVALANAKRELLADRPEWSHPTFWAGFVAVGNMDTIDIAPKKPFHIPLIASILILILTAYLLIRKQLFFKKRLPRG